MSTQDWLTVNTSQTAKAMNQFKKKPDDHLFQCDRVMKRPQEYHHKCSVSSVTQCHAEILVGVPEAGLLKHLNCIVVRLLNVASFLQQLFLARLTDYCLIAVTSVASCITSPVSDLQQPSHSSQLQINLQLSQEANSKKKS